MSLSSLLKILKTSMRFPWSPKSLITQREKFGVIESCFIWLVLQWENVSNSPPLYTFYPVNIFLEIWYLESQASIVYSKYRHTSDLLSCIMLDLFLNVKVLFIRHNILFVLFTATTCLDGFILLIINGFLKLNSNWIIGNLRKMFNWVSTTLPHHYPYIYTSNPRASTISVHKRLCSFFWAEKIR